MLRARHLRGLVPPLLIAAPPLFWILAALHQTSLTTLGRDQGIFQYVAWAVLHGARDYRDIRDVNGPLTHIVHIVFLLLGGANEHRFHMLDFAVSGLVFFTVGACLAGVGGSKPTWLERFTWGAAAWVVLNGQYLTYSYWDLAERESFFDWFILTSIALQLVLQVRLARKSRVTALDRALCAAVGALSAVTWFGKPTYALFTVVQAASLWADDESVPDRKRLLSVFGLGCAFGWLTQVAYLLLWGDLVAFIRIYVYYVPHLYRFIWSRNPVEILSTRAMPAALAIVTSVTILALIAERHLPRRLLIVALMPLVGLVSVVVQSKGYAYHFHPVTAGTALGWLTLAEWLAERDRLEPSRAHGRLAAIGGAAMLALATTIIVVASPSISSVWRFPPADTSAQRHSQSYLTYFRSSDFFPYELREAATYLREHTPATARIQVYGMDPYLLFLAKRRSATPYIYVHDLDAEAALHPRASPPDENDVAIIHAIRDANERDLLKRLIANPPAAFVFMDNAPFMAQSHAWSDFQTHCPTSAAWVSNHYEPRVSFGHEHIWMRDGD